MPYTKSQKMHLRKVRIEGNKAYYRLYGSACGNADLDTHKLKEFKYYMDNFPNDTCKNCIKKYKELKVARDK